MAMPDFSLCRPVKLPDGTLSPPPPHVREGVKWIIERPCALLADGMGGMKTSQAIIAAQFLALAGEVDRVVVVAPASVAPVWHDPDIGELPLHLFLPSRVVHVHGEITAWDYQTSLPQAPRLEWLVTSYEWARTSANYALLLDQCGPKTMLVLDESIAVKSLKSAQWAACRKIRERCGRVLELNGTPGDPEELFAQFRLMDWRIVGCKYVTEFRGLYAEQKAVLGRGGKPLKVALKGGRQIEITETVGWRNLEDFQSRLAPYVLRRLPKDMMDLPGALPPTTITVPLSPATWRVYREMRDELVAMLETGRIASSEYAATRALRLAQITGGFVGGVQEDAPDGWLDFGAADVGIKLEEAADPETLALLGSLNLRGDGMTAQGNTAPPAPNPSALVELAQEMEIARGEVEEVGREKLDATLDRIAEYLEEDSSLKILVWCRFTPELRRLMREAAKRFPKAMLGAVAGKPALEGLSEFGGSVASERAWALRLLNPRTAPAGPAIVGGTYGSGALGLNFTACHTVFYMSRDYSPHKAEQSAARVDRPGQTRPVRTTEVIATGPKGQKTIDHVIARAVRGKVDLNTTLASAWIRLLREE